MSAAASHFLGAPQSVGTGHAGTILLHAPYDISQFHPDLFAAYGVPMPEKLAQALEKRQADFLAGRALLSHAFTGLGLARQVVQIGPNRAPLWPVGLTGSISHTRNTCACILSTAPALHIGVDVENALSPRSDKAVRKFTLGEAERALIDTQPNMHTLAGMIFSAKETLFKALYPTVQSFFGFDCAEMRRLPSDGLIKLHLTKTLHPVLPKGSRFDIRYLQLPDQVLTWLICPDQSGSAPKSGKRQIR